MNLDRNHVFLAGFTLFIAWGLAVQWLPVLRYIAYAFSFGFFVALGLVLLSLLVCSRSPTSYDFWEPRIVPAIVSPTTWQTDRAAFLKAQHYEPAQLYPESFVISQALDTIISLALRDFLSSWYTNISKSPAFVNEVDKNVRTALASLADRLLNEDIVNIVVSRLVPIFTTHLRDFDQAERIVRGKALNRNITESEELDLAIAAKYRDGRIHPAASLTYSNTKSIQQDHLRKILIRVLPDLVSDTMMRSRAVLVLIEEIVSCAVLSPVLQMLADPDTWNQLVEAYGRTALQDRKTVKRMRAALDAHTSPVSKDAPLLELPHLAPNDSERAFERFVRAIRKTKTLSDARRFRSQISSQLTKESMVEGQDPVYIRRLEMGKRVLEQKIAKMSNRGHVPSQSQNDLHNATTPKVRKLSLVDIMHTAPGLSYFMEFMDRQRKMSMVQFWVVVDGFRNPLEDDFGDDRGAPTSTWTDTDRLDIAQIAEAYVPKPELKVPVESQEAIKAFLVSGRNASPDQYRAARMAILSAQSAVLEELESRHFPSFQKSDLYFKFLASDEASIKARQPSVHVDGTRSPSPALNRTATQPLLIIRSSSQAPPDRIKNLRRAAMSSSDVHSLATSKTLDNGDSPRRSLDMTNHKPLFDDGYDTDPLAQSTQSFGQESANGEQAQQQDFIDNMEAALTDIMTQSPHAEVSDEETDSLFGPSTSFRKTSKITDSSNTPLDFPGIESAATEKVRPSLATLGLVNTSSRIGVFSDNDLFPDEERFIEDEYVDQNEENGKAIDEDVHEAAPGDLGLTEAITVLSNDIERLVSQESVVDALTRKAELTNNVAELRILGKSKASLQREIRRKELQRQQYIVQESDNSLYGRASIQIKSVMVGKADDGREYALYVIEVQRQAGDQMPAATWVVTRRYSEFHELYQKLRRRYPSTRTLEFPRRRMVMKLQKQFLHNRRITLESYLQQLLRMPDVCRSRELRSFLSQQAILPRMDASNTSDTQDIVSRIYSSVTDGMDDFLGNIAVLDQLSVAGQNLISAATTQMGLTQNEIISIEPGSIAEAEAELRAFEDRELEPFVKPICDIFLEIFELNRGNNWLRGRAVVVVLHQLLGGTVERKIRDIFKSFFQEDSVLRYIETIKETMWPGGGKMRVSKPRTAFRKSKTKQEAAAMLATLVPDLAGSVVGRANAQAAARRISATMNNTRLNQHLVLTILDEIITVLFDVNVIGRKTVG